MYGTRCFKLKKNINDLICFPDKLCIVAYVTENVKRNERFSSSIVLCFVAILWLLNNSFWQLRNFKSVSLYTVFLKGPSIAFSNLFKLSMKGIVNKRFQVFIAIVLKRGHLITMLTDTWYIVVECSLTINYIIT